MPKLSYIEYSFQEFWSFKWGQGSKGRASRPYRNQGPVSFLSSRETKRPRVFFQKTKSGLIEDGINFAMLNNNAHMV